jgi:ABC-2 type transport system permease protein
MLDHNIKTVVAFEVARTVKRRSFWILALIVPVLFIAAMALSILSSSTADDAEDDTAGLAFVYADPAGLIDPAVAAAFGGTLVTDAAQGVADVQQGRVAAFFDYPADPVGTPVAIAALDEGLFGNGKYDNVASQLLEASASVKVGDPQLAQILAGGVEYERTAYRDGVVAPGPAALIVPALFALAYVIVLMVLQNQLINSFLEEKENRVAEMLLTSVKPLSLVIGKALSLAVVGLIQMLLIIGPIVVALVALGQLPFDLGALVIDPPRVVMAALLLIVGYLLLEALLMTVSLVSPSTKESGGLAVVVVMLSIAPIYIFMMLLSQPDSALSQVLTFFPPTGALTALIRNAGGTLSIAQGAIVAAELLASAVLVFWLDARLAPQGLLSYTKKLDIRAALKKK